MRKYDGLSISLYSALANGIKLLAGPITLLFISKNFDSEQISFYYTFFSLVAMQQLAELGLGHTLKQYISHAYTLDGGEWTIESKIKIKGYIWFGFKWFIAVALFVIIVVGPVGWYYYSDYSGNVTWLYPWVMLVLVSAFVTALIPIQILLDATQNQKLVYQAQSVSALVNSVAIWILITLDFGLYTIPLALMISNIIFYLQISRNAKFLFLDLRYIQANDDLKNIFKELLPLLSRVSVVWAVGFLFWNGFNLIAFKIYNVDYAGKVIFTIALARAGFGLADSFFSSQITVISYKISQGCVKQAQVYARRYQIIALSVLVVGYSVFCILRNIMPNFFLFQKIVSLDYCVSIFLFFISVLYLVTQNNFIRCFKVEPFVWVSVCQGVAVPLFFYAANSFGFNGYLYPCIVAICISIIASQAISRKFLANRSLTIVSN